MLKKAATLVLVCASISAWVGCGTTSSRFLYAAIPTSNTIVAYREDPNSGVLTQLSGSPISAGVGVQALAMHPSGQYLYAANSATNNLSVYAISNIGGLTEKTPRTNAGTSPALLAIDPKGSFLYVSNSGSFDISVYSIDASTGLLQPVPQTSGATAPIGLQAMNLALTPSGNFLYITGEESLGQSTQGVIEAFPVSQGRLGNPVAGSPFVTGNIPLGLAIDSTGTHLYTGNKQDNSISPFTINADGALSAVGSALGQTFVSPVSVLIDKSGKYLYVANQGSANVTAYAIGSDGSLGLLAGSPFGAASQPSFLLTDSSGNYFFVGSASSIQSFTLTPSSGNLTLVATYTVSATPTSMVITP